MYTGIDGGVGAVIGVHLADYGKAWVEVGQAAGREGGTTRGELQKGFPLVWGQGGHHVDKALESRTGNKERQQ